MRFIKKRRRSWGLMLLVVALVMLVWMAGLSAKGTTITVTSAADSGPGTLRQALLDAQSGDTITFDPAVFPPGSPATITLTSGQLPDLNDGTVTIDASNAGVILDGSAFSGGEDGLGITSSGNVVKGLQIVNFPGDGIEICCGAVQGNVIGGSTPAERNVIGGNGQNGIRIDSASAMSNTISGNYIGVDATGLAALPNDEHGIAIHDGASYNLIGGDTPGERNLISGNDGAGIRIWDSGTMSNTVSGNYIGTNVSGTVAIPNQEFGVALGTEAQNNLIGGDSAGERNLISGNSVGGINVAGTGVMGNVISGNYIGTNADGTAAIPNVQFGGIVMDDGAQYNVIGGDTAGERNVISGNDNSGICINVSGTMSNTVSGNYIGVDAIGTVAIPNGGSGISIGGASYNLIGGDTAGERNVISGNTFHGVVINMAGTDNNTVIGNFIGTDASGTVAVPNGEDGVLIVNGARFNTIGGDTPGERNVISGNGDMGVGLWDAGTSSNTIIGNYIGTDATGRAALPNRWNGVTIRNGASYNVIGGDTVGERNIISGNGLSGIEITGSHNNLIVGNYIGTDASGMDVLGNAERGIGVYDATLNVIERNLISGNRCNGIDLAGSPAANNYVRGNLIGTDAAGTRALANGCQGIWLGGGAHHNIVGGSAEQDRNIISGNNWGVGIEGAGTMNNTVTGNFIGINASGTAALGNNNAGVVFYNGSQRDVIGPDNTIAYNGTDGIVVYGSTCLYNTFTRNSIHSNFKKGIELVDGGNTELPPPVITETVGMTLSGTACAGCTLEFFSDDEDEGRVFEGSTTAESNGTFTFSRTESFTGPNVTATATDADGNTSEFSAPVSVPVLIIEPDVGTYWTEFDIKGSGWVPGEVVTVESFWPDSSPISSHDYTADANGDIDPDNWTAAPGEPAGIYTWTATGPTSGSVTKTFEVLPATEPLIAVYPDPGVVGRTFYIGGSGFQPSENINLTLTGPSTVTIYATTDEEGDLFAEWDSTGYLWGTYTVDAVGDQGSMASATFKILPAARIYLPLVTKNHQ